MLLCHPWKPHARCGNGTYLARQRRIVNVLEAWEIEGKHAVSWTIEFGRETPKDGRWATMTVHSEAEAVRQAKEYLDIGFVVNAQ